MQGLLGQAGLAQQEAQFLGNQAETEEDRAYKAWQLQAQQEEAKRQAIAERYQLEEGARRFDATQANGMQKILTKGDIDRQKTLENKLFTGQVDAKDVPAVVAQLEDLGTFFTTEHKSRLLEQSSAELKRRADANLKGKNAELVGEKIIDAKTFRPHKVQEYIDKHDMHGVNKALKGTLQKIRQFELDHAPEAWKMKKEEHRSTLNDRDQRRAILWERLTRMNDKEAFSEKDLLTYEIDVEKVKAEEVELTAQSQAAAKQAAQYADATDDEGKKLYQKYLDVQAEANAALRGSQTLRRSLESRAQKAKALNSQSSAPQTAVPAGNDVRDKYRQGIRIAAERGDWATVRALKENARRKGFNF
jgi:hypothetical protein